MNYMDNCRFCFVLLLKDKDDDVYTRDFAKPTLEDHFDKTIIPKVMQVSVGQLIYRFSQAQKVELLGYLFLQ